VKNAFEPRLMNERKENEVQGKTGLKKAPWMIELVKGGKQRLKREEGRRIFNEEITREVGLRPE